MTEEEKLVRREALRVKNLARIRKYREENKDQLNRYRTVLAKYRREVNTRATFSGQSDYNPESRMCTIAKKRAKKKNQEYNLCPADLFIPMICPYLGIRLTNIRGRHQSNVSLDRIDSSKGYTKDNVQVISYLANTMKQNATREQLIAFAKGVLRIHDRTSDNSISP